jgi:1,4-dihydroxy-2-naphthoyl-CoA hydrolase
MTFEYDYTIQFRDTDAAGVAYFASIVSLCHVAYEASLIETGIDLKLFVSNPEFAVPIAHVAADFLRPLYCGDRVSIAVTPQEIDRGKFEIKYQISIRDSIATDRQNVAATVTTRHVVIDPQTRKRQDLPTAIDRWLVRWR